MDNSVINPPATLKAKLKQKFKDSTLQDHKGHIFNKKREKKPRNLNSMSFIQSAKYKPIASGVLSLGNYAKFSATFTNEASEESINYQKLLWDLKTQSGIILSASEKFTSEKIMLRTRGKDGKIKRKEIGKKEKVCRVLECGVKPVPLKKNTHIDYVKGEKGERFFAGLQHCGSVWVCPVCSYKIQTEKTKELNNALLSFTHKGYAVFFGAMTLPHYKSEKLSDNLNLLVDGFNWVKSHRSVKSLISNTVTFDVINKETGEIKTVSKPDFWYIRALEITYGVNGWHPHIHPLFILRKEDAPVYLKAFNNTYLKYLRRNNKGTEHIEKRAFKYEEWDGSFEKLSEYVNKIKINEGINQDKANEIFEIKKEHSRRTLADEITRGQNKKSREGISPWDILKTINNKSKWNFPGSPRKLFIEYAEETKGKSMLQACQYFYEYAGIEEKQEAEILTDDKAEKVLFSIEKPLWKKLVKEKLIFSIRQAYEIGQINGYGVLSVEKILKDKGVKFTRDSIIFNDG